MGKGRDKKKKGKTTTAKNKDKPLKVQKKHKPEEEEEDIDAILEEIKQQQLLQQTIQESIEPPTRRANASLSVDPLTNDLILFGGEYYNGKNVYLYNDFFRYNIDKQEWKRYIIPNGPQPRSSHQTVITNQGLLFVWGGEFTSPNETSYFHYKDFWMMDLKTLVWEKIETRNRPPPRSGHRMCLYKHFIVMFGGFYDTNKETKYYDDLWIFDTQEFKWTKLDLPDPRPTQRSGFQFFCHQDSIVLYGGYHKTFSKGQKPVGNVLQDHWLLKVGPDPNLWRWERRKKGGSISPGSRSGCTIVCHKGKGILFGGVSDVQEDDENLESVCHNDMLQYHVEANKWHPFNLNKKKKTETQEESPVPGPRFNCMMQVSRNVLYLYGGVYEQKDKEITLNDFWALNLDKINEWQQLMIDDQANSWEGEVSDDDSSEESESEQESESESESEEELVLRLDEQEDESLQTLESMDIDDKIDERIPDPLPGEKLGQYFARTQIEWQVFCQEELENTGSGKQLRKDAFELAQTRFNQKLPENERLHQEMLENDAFDKKRDQPTSRRNR